MFASHNHLLTDVVNLLGSSPGTVFRLYKEDIEWLLQQMHFYLSLAFVNTIC